MLRRLIGEDIELVTLPGPDLGVVKVDHGQMEQVLMNLVVNARDAMPDGGRLTVETANVTLDDSDVVSDPNVPAGEYVVLVVSDTGTGISDEAKTHVFEPFFTTKGVGEGTGLGLSTCYGIVTQSGGYISIESEPGKGARFKTYLPRVDIAPGPAPPPDDSSKLPRGTERVLLVEDEPSVMRLASRVLREQGYQVLEATNGVEALRVAEEHIGEELHLLFSDIVMPLMGGMGLAERLRALHPETKVLLTSGYANEGSGSSDILETGTSFVEKPFTPTILARKIRQVLDK